MKLSKLTLAVVTALSAGASYDALAIDLYVDTKTKQIYAEPGPHRERMGSFIRVEDAAPQSRPDTADAAELSAVHEAVLGSDSNTAYLRNLMNKYN